MANVGIAPHNPLTSIGSLREFIGDTEYVGLVPEVVGYGSYINFSDDELNALLASSNGSNPRAAGYAYMKLAGQAAVRSMSFKTEDLAVDWRGRAADLRLIAQSFFDQADGIDAATGKSTYFNIVSTTTVQQPYPEALVRPAYKGFV